jgi:hypothetical protein
MSHRPGQLENYAAWELYNPRTGDWLGDTKDILLRFLQDVFFKMEPGKGCFHFEPNRELGGTDEGTTELILTDTGPVNTDSVEKRPAIIVSRGAFSYGNTSLDQMLDYDISTGKRTHTDLLSGYFVLNCVSRAGLEAERLALITAKVIRIYRRELQKAGFFQIGSLVQVGTETPAGSLVEGDSAEDFINVPVSFPTYYQESWTWERDAALLTGINTKILAINAMYNGDPAVPGSIDVNGVPIEGAEGVIVQPWQVE